jgi:hypothetical protein
MQVTAGERLIIVGDVHGCIDELDALLRLVGHSAKSDHLLLVGDLVAKGPDSEAVVTLARKLNAGGVRGNHDQRMLDYRRMQKKSEPLPELKPQHQQVLETLSDKSYAYLESLPYWHRIPAYNLIAVHAGIVPTLPLEEQHPRDVVTMRSLKPDGTASSRMNQGVPWATKWKGPELVVFGHDAVRGLQQHPFALGLDTGCCYGRELTAYLLPEKKLVSVPAKRCYSSPRNGS